mmetsp:Transcript_9880/g.34027  ORF Transcript_9880/g.34027 Transcript_9880/m.34027 type:complete len:172 (-) Transcript_9880:123-638(-)
MPVHSIDLSRNHVGTRGVVEIFRNAAKSKSLNALDLSQVRIDLLAVETFAATLVNGQYAALKTLCLANTTLDDALSVKLVRALRRGAAPPLALLDLSSNAIGSVNNFGLVPMGAGRGGLPSLKRLNVSWNLLGPESVAGISHTFAPAPETTGGTPRPAKTSLARSHRRRFG